MTWRSSTDPQDRIFAALPYLLPLHYAMPFGESLFRQFPIVGDILGLLVLPIAIVYNILPLGGFAGLLVFFVLLIGVVRNPQIGRFVRFNTMQAILIGIALSLASIIFNFLLAPALSSSGLIIETLVNVIFLGVLATCSYSIVQSLRGLYPEIPGISVAAHNQVP